MAQLSDTDLDYIRRDVETGMQFTKLKMTGDLIRKLTTENPQISKDTIMAEIANMRKANGWDI